MAGFDGEEGFGFVKVVSQNANHAMVGLAVLGRFFDPNNEVVFASPYSSLFVVFVLYFKEVKNY